jgi:hypothetical protein
MTLNYVTKDFMELVRAACWPCEAQSAIRADDGARVIHLSYGGRELTIPVDEVLTGQWDRTNLVDTLSAARGVLMHGLPMESSMSMMMDQVIRYVMEPAIRSQFKVKSPLFKRLIAL